MSGFFRSPRFWAAAAATFALAGAAGWGVRIGAQRPPLVLVDASPSSAAQAPAGARTFGHSDLGRAVREAAAERLELHTDGCDTSGNPPSDPGFPVDVVLAPRRDHVGILAVLAPARTPLGRPFGVRVKVGRTAGDPAPQAAVRIRLERDGARLGRDREVRLERGEQRTIYFVDSLENAGVARYEARLPGSDEARAAFVRAGGEPVVGVVGPPPAWAGFTFEPVRPDASYDAYLVTASVRDPRQRASIESGVRGGAGLLAVGAVDAPLLPLTENPPEGRAVVLLLDVSGSMEPHLAALRQGFFELCARLDPSDRVAIVRFRDGVVDASGWRDAASAFELWTTPLARGNTKLQPALDRAAELLAAAKARHRRLYVVSDGAWDDGDRLTRVPDVHRAALFTADPPPAAVRWFPLHARGAERLTTALRELEEQAPDRIVAGPVAARAVDVPGWLAGAVPGDASFEDFPRLYPKGLDERIAYAAGDVPLLAAREEGGRIVQTVRGSPEQLQACLADVDVLLRAWRDGRALVLEATRSGGAPFRVGDQRVPARAAGTARWTGRIEQAPPGALVVLCAGARCAVPPLAAAEQAGLFPNEEYARALARVSGGRFEGTAPSKPERPRAVHATLLAAALLILGSAWLRRR